MSLRIEMHDYNVVVDSVVFIDVVVVAAWGIVNLITSDWVYECTLCRY